VACWVSVSSLLRMEFECFLIDNLLITGPATFDETLCRPSKLDLPSENDGRDDGGPSSCNVSIGLLFRLGTNDVLVIALDQVDDFETFDGDRATKLFSAAESSFSWLAASHNCLNAIWSSFSSISCSGVVTLFADMAASVWFRSSNRFFTLVEFDLLPLNDNLVSGADCAGEGGGWRELVFVPGDPGGNIEPFAFLVARRLPSPFLSLFFLNLAMNPLKPGPGLGGVGAGEDCNSIMTVVADTADSDPLCSALEIETSPEWTRGRCGRFGEVAGEVDSDGLRSTGKGETSSPVGKGLALSVPLSFLNLCPSFSVPEEFNPGPELGGVIGVVGRNAIVSTLMDADSSVGLDIWSLSTFLFVAGGIGGPSPSGNLGFEGLFRRAIVAASTLARTCFASSSSSGMLKFGELSWPMNSLAPAISGVRGKWGVEAVLVSVPSVETEREMLSGDVVEMCKTGGAGSCGPNSASARSLFRLVGLSTDSETPGDSGMS